MVEHIILYSRGSDTSGIRRTLRDDYQAIEGTHYTVDSYPGEDLDLEEGVPVLGIYQESIDEEIHHIGRDTILEAFQALNLDHIERELEP